MDEADKMLDLGMENQLRTVYYYYIFIRLLILFPELEDKLLLAQQQCQLE